MSQPCKYENLIPEMRDDIKKVETLSVETNSDLKVLISEFKAMNGDIGRAKERFDKHESESEWYRDKVKTLWSVCHTLKYAVMLLFGSGIIWKVVEFLTK